MIDAPFGQNGIPLWRVSSPDEGVANLAPRHDLAQDLRTPFPVDLDGRGAHRVHSETRDDRGWRVGKR